MVNGLTENKKCVPVTHPITEWKRLKAQAVQTASASQAGTSPPGSEGISQVCSKQAVGASCSLFLHTHTTQKKRKSLSKAQQGIPH